MTQRDDVIKLLRSHRGWVTRATIKTRIGKPKGYSAILGQVIKQKPPDPMSLIGLGWVESRGSRNSLEYRLTHFGREQTKALRLKLTTWQRALTALEEVGGIGSLKAITTRALENDPTTDAENVRKDLIMLCVNDPHRLGYRRAEKPRTTSPPDKYDRVFRVKGAGEKTLYEIYNPDLHGVWEIYAHGKILDVRLAISATELAVCRKPDANNPAFDPADERSGKKFAVSFIASRDGQTAFRNQLLRAYNRRCAITRCAVEAILEAAHIVPFDGQETHHVTNGLLLRSDIHLLFDLGLIRITEKLSVEIHPRVREDITYKQYHLKQLSLPDSLTHSPSRKSLAAHRRLHAATWAC